MPARDLLVFLGLAVADSLNPFSVAAMVYLLGTDRPAVRGAVFAGGTFAAYLAGALAISRGWAAFMARVQPRFPSWAPGAALVLAGAACIGVGAWSWRRAVAGRPLTPPPSLGVGTTLGFALASTASDLPTAVPLFAAVNQLTTAGETGARGAALLILYCVVYVAPLLALLALRLGAAGGAGRLISRVRDAVDWGFARLLPPGLVLGGVYLLVAGGRRLA